MIYELLADPFKGPHWPLYILRMRCFWSPLRLFRMFRGTYSSIVCRLKDDRRLHMTYVASALLGGVLAGLNTPHVAGIRSLRPNTYADLPLRANALIESQPNLFPRRRWLIEVPACCCCIAIFALAASREAAYLVERRSPFYFCGENARVSTRVQANSAGL